MTRGKANSSKLDWTPEADREEAEGYYQDWENSQDWQYSSSWLATALHRQGSSADLLCRASGQEDDYSQLFVEDVTGHSFQSTRLVV